MDSSLALRRALAERVLLLGQVLSVVALPFAASGCTEKACLSWNSDDRKNESSGGTTAATTGGAGGSGGMGAGGAGGSSGGMGGAGGTGTGGAAASAEIKCPSRARALQLLGDPSCAEAIQSLDDDGEYDSDNEACCYKVTTQTRPCTSKE